VGWLDHGDGSVTFAYAAAGDTNLDWSVDILDIANVIAGAKFNSGLPAAWNEGDFNDDGLCDMLDVADLMSTDLYAASPYNGVQPSAVVAAVPEPSMEPISVLAIGFTVVMRMIHPWKPSHERGTCAETTQR